MSDSIIKILPESVANQIAAGEVVQRPASVVKELLENSVDAGAENIQLIIKDAGKTLIQVIDDGCGMSEIDARLAFERHATSKISSIEDLYAIRTMGFRGEALASIASVAQVEMKTKTQDNLLGTSVKIEGGQFISQEPCQSPKGTSIAVKNLFFNIPVRRNFLKSNSLELKYIYDEFYHVALSHPHIAFKFIDGDLVKYNLEKTTLKQRIVQIFGSSYQKKLIPIEEQTVELKIKGFIIKPEFAKKQRGEQFFFVNNRFIKSPFLHRVVVDAFKNYIPQDHYPGYFIFIDIDPEEIDVNVHPTKTEIVFRNENFIAPILRSTILHSIGMFNIAPSIDFDTENKIDIPIFNPQKAIKIPHISVNYEYNPFKTNVKSNTIQKTFHSQTVKSNSDKSEKKFSLEDDVIQELKHLGNYHPDFLFLKQRFLVTSVKSGLLFIDVNSAQQRIYYDLILDKLNKHTNSTAQQLMYKETIQLSPQHTEILLEILGELNSIGFSITYTQNNEFICEAIPVELVENFDLKDFIASLIEAYQNQLLDTKKEKNIRIAFSVAKKLSNRQMNFNTKEEMNNFVEKLFSCPMHSIAPDGSKITWILDYSEILKNFK